MNENTSPHLVLACGIFDDEAAASRVVEKLIEDDFPMDQLSLLHRSGGSGDDMLGLAFTNTEERVKVWGEHGAAWGALWGLLAGATGLFMLPVGSRACRRGVGWCHCRRCFDRWRHGRRCGTDAAGGCPASNRCTGCRYRTDS